MYYLTNLPTLQKKLRVMDDWTWDIFFKRKVTMLKTILEDRPDADSKRKKVGAELNLKKRRQIKTNYRLKFVYC